jgi:hypothetical protein
MKTAPLLDEIPVGDDLETLDQPIARGEHLATLAGECGFLDLEHNIRACLADSRAWRTAIAAGLAS